MTKKFEVEKDFHNTRFDRWFKNKVLDIPQGLIEKIIRKNLAKVNGKKTKSSYRVQELDIIEIFNIEKIKKTEKNLITQYIPSNTERKKYDDFIIEDNENFIVINKPAGIAVQSGTKSFKNIVDTLRKTKYFEDTKPFIVHRLDKETSGILIVAKTREYAQLFTSLFRIRKIHKIYIAVVYGQVSKELKILEDDLTLYEKERKIVQKATSYIKVLKSNSEYSLLELKPITGRKHQLRKQLYGVGCPIYGDQKYKFSNTDKAINKNLMLHSYQIKFMIKDKKYTYKALLPDYFKKLLKTKRLRFPSS